MRMEGDMTIPRIIEWSRIIVILVLCLSIGAIPQGNVRAACPTVVTNTLDSGAYSLRDAIYCADVIIPGPNTVTFAIPPSGPGYDPVNSIWTITLTSGALSLTASDTTIDGTTQDSFNVFGPDIEVHQSSTITDVFFVQTSAATINRLSITGGYIGVHIANGASANFVVSNYIGLDGMQVPDPNQIGVRIGNESYANQVISNSISGNTTDGIQISNSGSNIIFNNLIGTNNSSADTGNGGDGIYISGSSSGNFIGTSPGNPNVISNNHLNGIHVDAASSNTISYNTIGTDNSGLMDQGNLQNGVQITNGADGTNISNNLISGNDQHGIYIFGGDIADTVISSNLIGSDYSGNSPIGNGWHGVAVYNGPIRTSIYHNTIVANGWSGLVLLDTMSNTSSYNHIGISESSSSVDLGNAFFGIHILGGFNMVVYDTIAHNGLANPANGDGIRVDGATYAASYNIMSNLSIYGNGGKGIENINGGNNDLAGPILDSDASCKHISGSVPLADGYVDIYSGPDDEGRTFMLALVPDPSGYFEYNGDFPGPYISATWTDGYPKTSEFSARFACVRNYVPIIMKP
jgi:hypothetical protein